LLELYMFDLSVKKWYNSMVPLKKRDIWHKENLMKQKKEKKACKTLSTS
jgi:hypothetical protein